jgi:hypothetical protein
MSGEKSMTRRDALGLLGKSAATAAAFSLPSFSIGQQAAGLREFDVRDFGASGDGVANDTAALQRAIDAAGREAGGGRVLVPGGRRFITGTLVLRSRVNLHLADDAELLASVRPEDYETTHAVLTAEAGCEGLRISGTGSINGRSGSFMEAYDAAGEWWTPKAFRPRLAVLMGCRDLAVENISFLDAPEWTLHLVGCDRVMVDGVRIRNQMDVPNCDGIDPDHCRNVEIKNCRITCGDDAIVVKATRPFARLGGSSNIRVSDCILETQDSGLKIGTETVADIHDIRFERCQVISSCRGCTIQLRDEGSVYNVLFKDISFTARYHADPWWGRGEAISLTALPRTKGGRVGRIHDVRLQNVSGRAENSVRISGSAESRIQNVAMEGVNVTLDRWTKYRGGVWDNRPTNAYPPIEEHATPAIHVRHADQVALQRCSVSWGKNIPEYFTHALEAEQVTDLSYPEFAGKAAHPERDEAIRIHP